MKKVFKLEWDDELSEGWMNEDNLKTLLFTKESVRESAINVKEIKKDE